MITLGLNILLSLLSTYAFTRIRQTLHDLREVKLDLADLTERFERFQSREGMRKARETKHSDADMAAELAKLATVNVEAPVGTKQTLRRRIRGMN